MSAQPHPVPFRLNLGCCDQHIEGYVGVDCFPGPNVDQIADLNKPWPWGSSSVDEILAYDIIEHLPNQRHTMNEAFRVLKPGGKFKIIVPVTSALIIDSDGKQREIPGPGAFQDATHVSFWHRHSFWYFEERNVYRERFARSYGITARFIVTGEKNEITVDGPKLHITLEKPIFCD